MMGSNDGELATGVVHVYMPSTPEIAQFALGDLNF
jgi:hypothetical protein